MHNVYKENVNIDARKYIGCRECITICENGVLAFDETMQKLQWGVHIAA
jgi:Fe-S-cluster-containing dehydrogenase component